jgi:hypothetical protein
MMETEEYSSIGINRINSLLRAPNCPFVLLVSKRNWSNGGRLKRSPARN